MKVEYSRALHMHHVHGLIDTQVHNYTHSSVVAGTPASQAHTCVMLHLSSTIAIYFNSKFLWIFSGARL